MVAKKKKIGSTEGECHSAYLPSLAKKRHAKKNKNEVTKKQKVGGTERLKRFFAKVEKGQKLAKKRRSKNNKNEVAKKQKVRSTKAEPLLMFAERIGLKFSKNRKWICNPRRYWFDENRCLKESPPGFLDKVYEAIAKGTDFRDLYPDELREHLRENALQEKKDIGSDVAT